MATKKGNGPEPLDPKVAKKLLDMLSTDNEFRRLFKKDAQAALLKVGWKPPRGRPEGVPPLPGGCIQLKAGDRIAPKAKIIRERAKLEQAVTSPFRFTFACPAELKA